MYENGNEYNGEWKDSKREGTGMFKNKGGESYNALWENDYMKKKLE